jgi:hypothetical protein
MTLQGLHWHPMVGIDKCNNLSKILGKQLCNKNVQHKFLLHFHQKQQQDSAMMLASTQESTLEKKLPTQNLSEGVKVVATCSV